MADYHPLLSRAVAALEPNTTEARQAVYERASVALSRQMAAMDPPVPQAIVDRELAALAAVVERIEREQRIEEAAAPPARAEPAATEPVAPVPPPQARPQVMRREAAVGNRKPLIAVAGAIGLLIVMGVATLAFLRRNEPAAVANRPAASQEAAAPAPRPSAPAGKTDDRVASAGGEQPARPQQEPSSPVAPSRPPETSVPTSTAPPSPPQAAPAQVAVANRMVLILEGKEEPQKVEIRHGTVLWRTDMVSGGQGQALQLAIRAIIDVPEARTRAEITIQRNRDPAFPASHTIQVQFSSIGTSELGSIQNLSQIELRQTENQPGYPLAGQGIAVMENLFLVALAQIEPAMSRNIDMLKTRPLLYLEFQSVGSRRGAMIIEKGVSGQQAFDEAFRNWE